MNSGSGAIQETENVTAGATPSVNLGQKSSQSKSIYYQLFRKYIDNRVLLFIQESRFPRKLDVILVEPCSQLTWRYVIEPRQITTGMSSLHLVDSASLEMMVAVMLDENENCETNDKKLYEHVDAEDGEDDDEHFPVLRNTDNWANIKEMNENAKFVKDHELIEDTLQITICKRRNAFCVLLSKPSKQVIEKTEEDEGDQLLTFERSKAATDGLEFRISPEGGDTQLAKVIRSKGLSYNLLLFKIQGNQTIIKVIELTPIGIKTIFKFIFIDEKGTTA